MVLIFEKKRYILLTVEGKKTVIIRLFQEFLIDVVWRPNKSFCSFRQYVVNVFGKQELHSTAAKKCRTGEAAISRQGSGMVAFSAPGGAGEGAKEDRRPCCPGQGKKEQGMGLIEKYSNKYPWHTAFKGENNRAQQQTSAGLMDR